LSEKIIKSVIINRAVPGSGKTTISKKITTFLEKLNINTAVHSTDDFFMIDGKYYFDFGKLHRFHQQNYINFENSIKKNINLVICDNINLVPWQTKRYTDIARKYNFQIIFITFEPRELKKHIECQLQTPEKPDAHNVPEAELKRFITEYYIYNPLLYKISTINPFIHKNYSWDSKLLKRIEVKSPTPYFDSDHIIKIYPGEYHNIKRTIGSQIYSIMKNNNY